MHYLNEGLDRNRAGKVKLNVHCVRMSVKCESCVMGVFNIYVVVLELVLRSFESC